MAMGIKNRSKIINHVAALDSFTVGNVSGRWYQRGQLAPVGKLAAVWQGILAKVDGPLYLVYSYDTPIAWRPAGGDWRFPRETYTKTTTHHQSLTRQGMDLWERKSDLAVASRG